MAKRVDTSVITGTPARVRVTGMLKCNGPVQYYVRDVGLSVEVDQMAGESVEQTISRVTGYVQGYFDSDGQAEHTADVMANLVESDHGKSSR